MRSPIDALIDKACGHTPGENTNPADALTDLADAAVAWLADPGREGDVKAAARKLKHLGWDSEPTREEQYETTEENQPGDERRYRHDIVYKK